MNITCEVCEEESEIELDALPTRSSDIKEWACPSCKSTMYIGWFAVPEVRRVIEIKQSKKSDPCSVCFSRDCGGECIESDMDFNN